MASVTKLTCPGERFTQALEVPMHIDQVSLDGTNATSYSVPSGARFLLLSCTSVFYVNQVNTAVVPAAGITDGSGSFAIPFAVEFKVAAGTTLSMIASGACFVTIGVYK